MCMCVYIYIYICIYVGLSFPSGCNVLYFPIGSNKVLLKIILKSLIHINALDRMEINLLSKCDRMLFVFIFLK